MEEFVFDFIRNRSFYSVTVDKELIKTSQVWSRSRRQALIAFNKNSDDFQETDDARIRFKSAPLSMYSHIESVAVRAWPTGYQFVMSLYWNLYRFIAHNAVFILTILMMVAAVTCFYTPGTYNTNFTHDSSPQMSYNLTIVIFVFTVVAVMLHILYAFNMGSKNRRLLIVSLVAFVFLLVALAMAITLMDVAYTNGGRAKPHATNWQSAVDQFTCYCDKNVTASPTGVPSYSPTLFPTVRPSANPTVIPTQRPTEFPTVRPTFLPSVEPTIEPTANPLDPTQPPTPFPSSTQPTSQPSRSPTSQPSGQPSTSPTNSPTNGSMHWDNSYTFECTWDQYAASNYNHCDMNCGVCGETYYAPFVTFAVFTAAYLLLMLFLAFEAFFAGHVFWTGFKMISSYKPVTHMNVTIHGSRSFGYPLRTRMTLPEMLRLERYLKEYTEREREHKPVDYMRHMAYVSSGVKYHKWFNWGWYTGY